MPPGGNRTVRFVVAADYNQYKQMTGVIEQSGGKIVASQQRVSAQSRRTGQDLQQHGAAGREAFLVMGQAMDATGARVGPLATVFYRLDMIFDAMEQKSSRVSRALTGIGVAGLAIGGAAMAFGAKEQQALSLLQSAVEDTGKSWDDYRGQLEAAAKAQAHYGTSADEAMGALATLTRATKDPTVAIRDMDLAQNIAAAGHMHLADAAKLLGQVYAGNFRGLSQFGINVKSLIDPTKELTKAQHEQASAAAAMSTAQQHLSDVHARVAAAEEQSQAQYQSRLQSAMDAEQNANQRVADSTGRVADARRNLRDVETQVHEATQLSIDDAYELMHAHDSLADIERRMATGELTGQAAFEAKRDAQERLGQVEADQREKQKITLSQQHQLRDAHEAITKALTAQTRAQDDQAKAHAKTQQVRAAGPAPISLGLRQEEAAAERAYVKAQARVAQANRDMAKAKADMAAFGSQIDQVWSQLNQATLGAADKIANTAIGQIKRIIAETENTFSDLGMKWGSEITAVSTGLLVVGQLTNGRVGGMIGNALRKIGLLRPAMASEGAAMTAEAVVAGEASSVAIAGPIGLALAGVAIAAYGLWKHWDQIWGWIKNNKALAGVIMVLAPITGALVGLIGTLRWVSHHWDQIWGTIQHVADQTALALTDVWNSLVWTYNHTIGLIPGAHKIPEIVQVKGTVAGATGAMAGLTVLPTTAPAPAARAAPAAPSRSPAPSASPRAYATGTTRVPGQDGQPVLAVVHGGEEITPAWDSAGATRGGDGVTIGTMHLQVTVQAPALDRRTAYDVGKLVADGVHDQLLIKKRSGNPSLGLS